MEHYVYISLIVIAYFKLFSTDRYTHENPIYTRKLGQCITIEAQVYFHYPKQLQQIIWKKDSKPLIPSNRVKINGKSLSITSLRRSDHAYYEVTVTHVNKSVTETTDSWLNIRDCSRNEEEELPSSLYACEDLCTEKCTKDWVYVVSSQSKCLKYFKERLSWADASEKCQTIGGELTSIDSLPENSFAADLLETANGGWIGLNDRSEENKYIWSFDKRDVPSFYTWGDGEPSNYNRGCNIENCVLMNRSNGKWIDYMCSAFRPFVCQTEFSKNVTINDNSWKCSSSACYKYFNNKLTWLGALKRCDQLDGKLAEIRSIGENSFIANVMNEDSWIGLNDLWEAGMYTWNGHNGQPRDGNVYFNWDTGEPNDKFYEPLSKNCGGEDCVQMRKFNDSVTWHDLSCDTRIPFLCEKIRNRSFSTGAYVAMVIGCLIFVATFIGVIQAAYEKHKRTAVKDIIKAAYQQNISQRDENSSTREYGEPNLVITHTKYE